MSGETSGPGGGGTGEDDSQGPDDDDQDEERTGDHEADERPNDGDSRNETGPADSAGEADPDPADDDAAARNTASGVAYGSVTLKWTLPTEYEDGTPLQDLAGYRIYWRNISATQRLSIEIDDPRLSAIVISNLPAGIYLFSMTAYNEAGVESALSNIITRVVVGAYGGNDYAADTETTDDRSQSSAANDAESPPYLMLSGGPPAAVVAGQFYQFAPVVETNSGSTPAFAIEGLPQWAGFDETSGDLYGRPGYADIGHYDPITISAMDGVIETSLPAFSIDVLAPGAALGAVTLSWTPPTENVDGSPLLDLAGYRIYWRNVSSSESLSIEVDNPGLSAIVIGNLPAGTYKFSMTSYNAAGVESALSNTVTFIVGAVADDGYSAGTGTADSPSQAVADDA